MSKFGNSNGVSCELDDFVVCGDLSKFVPNVILLVSGSWIQITVVEFTLEGLCGRGGVVR